MIDPKSIAVSMADTLNGMLRATSAIPVPKSSPEFERWKTEMAEASKHVLLAFGVDPAHLKSPVIPCGGAWYVEWVEGADGQIGQWRAAEKTT